MAADQVFQVKVCVGGSCCIGWVITIIVLIATSLKTLDQGQYAMKFSHWSQGIEGDVITDPGVKSVGPLNSLVRYPSVYQMVYFDSFKAGFEAGTNEVLRPPVQSRTHDGLQVNVKISFQWKLEPGSLADIYSILGGAEDLIDGDKPEDKMSFVAAIVRFARGVLTNVCSQYTAAQFFANQTSVEYRMLDALTQTFNQPSKKLHISIRGLQLRSVDLPDKYEASIADTQKEEQDYQTAMAERATNIMSMETELMQAKKKQEQLMVDVQGNVSAILEENQAWVEQYTNFQRQQADAYAALLHSLVNGSQSIRDPFKALLELVRQKALKAHHTSKVPLTM